MTVKEKSKITGVDGCQSVSISSFLISRYLLNTYGPIQSVTRNKMAEGQTGYASIEEIDKVSQILAARPLT